MELYKFFRQMRFERLGCFTYSHEENTAAYELEDNIPEEVKQRRAAEIMEIQSPNLLGAEPSQGREDLPLPD